MTSTITFLGAAGTVTGSCYLVEHDGQRLLVDCGMFQGPKTLKELNYRPFPFRPEDIGAVLLTHAHIDHSGLLPKLITAGYRGRIVTTEATRDLLTYMLPDSGYIQETEVKHLNQRLHRRGGAPVQPIYTKQDAERSLDRIDAIAFHDWFDVLPGIRARYWPAGHILGAASIELELTGPGKPTHLLFSGDLGAAAECLHTPPEAPSGLDYLIVESTYGDRRRDVVDAAGRRLKLAAEVQAALDRGGNLIIPAFAIERTQELLFDIGQLIRDGVLGKVQVFLDSPLAVHATEVFRKHIAELGAATGTPNPFDGSNIRFVGTIEESKKLNTISSGAIIMAASGMCDAGRIRHHLMASLWRPECTVLLVGYQAAGTLGRLLRDGASSVRIMGEEIRVRARIRDIDVYSAHADQAELLSWITAREPISKAILLTHGEPTATAGLASLLTAQPHPGRPQVLCPGIGSSLALATAKLSPPKELPIEGALQADWHNLQAGFLLDLANTLRQAANDQARHDLLRRLAGALHGQR
ncbi:MBL fold metallo-hydrolase [Telmatospirillum sp.]|uniref:MBL fold metallo-hydrolase n=1 Tax=Telmatospirillum sp. TaxID=2079197 RepID=UPI00284323A3|nr:MBL fold metallo-hydrolase [Telmatospirillum sp.]MDR3441119.1 MBL fold metallo-hydrolase [Telmatospirillum sp.]